MDDEELKIREDAEKARLQVIQHDQHRSRDHAIQHRERQRSTQDEAQQQPGRGSKTGGEQGRHENKPRPIAHRQPKGIPSSMIVKLPEPETGEGVVFAAGELRQEQEEEEAIRKRLLDYEQRIPELPPAATLKDFDPLSGQFVGGTALERASKKAKVPTETVAALPPIERIALPPHLSALASEEDDEVSRLEAHISFYVHCKSFLPKGTPEQHWEVFGRPQQLSREAWTAFVEREKGASMLVERREFAERANANANAVLE